MVTPTIPPDTTPTTDLIASARYSNLRRNSAVGTPARPIISNVGLAAMSRGATSGLVVGDRREPGDDGEGDDDRQRESGQGDECGFQPTVFEDLPLNDRFRDRVADQELAQEEERKGHRRDPETLHATRRAMTRKVIALTPCSSQLPAALHAAQW